MPAPPSRSALAPSPSPAAAPATARVAPAPSPSPAAAGEGRGEGRHAPPSAPAPAPPPAFARAATRRPIPPPLAPGEFLGPYRVLEQIGQGGMGAVYKAVQTSLDRVVALKVLPPAFAADSDFVRRFDREAKALAGLNHPNIVAVYDLGRARDLYYFAMEHVDGTSLRARLARRDLDAATTLRLLPALCDALAYAHGEGVIHRDIKPENILIDRRGRVKIADFGLARIAGCDAPTDAGITRTGVVMGTLDYMAPEQRLGTRDVDQRADIYALGVVLYEMLTGELPYGRWEPPSRRSGADPRLDAVIERMLERDPSRRFASMS
ncbi:MAG: serine/threonine protein kinase, partial [Planctomycetes bacterium]|nr:serine/threonine protein kinase [Planctomycetota bacterium]